MSLFIIELLHNKKVLYMWDGDVRLKTFRLAGMRADLGKIKYYNRKINLETSDIPKRGTGTKEGKVLYNCLVVSQGPDQCMQAAQYRRCPTNQGPGSESSDQSEASKRRQTLPSPPLQNHIIIYRITNDIDF